MSIAELSFDLPSDRPLRLSPTDISQFVRLEQCDRFLRLMLYDRRHGRGFMWDNGLVPEEFPPLLTRSGKAWEAVMETAIGERLTAVKLGREPDESGQVLSLLRGLLPGQARVIFQAGLRVALFGWELAGNPDVIRAERRPDGALDLLVADMKSSAEVSVEHRLQVAFYHGMLEELLRQAGLPLGRVRTAILYQGPADGEPEDADKAERDAASAAAELGLENAYLEVVDDARAYLDAVQDLVTGPESRARRAATVKFGELAFHLGYKCDGCLYNPLCMRRAAETDDLSLIPHLTAAEKGALQRAGVRTVSELAHLKELVQRPSAGGGRSPELVPAVGKEADCRRVATTWPVGPRLDELVHRARAYRKWRGEAIERLTFIPGQGHGTLPCSTPTQNPNLVRVYLDAQHDYTHDRIYLVGALVTACQNGRVEQRGTVVRMTEGPPDTPEKERALIEEWARETLRMVVELAAPDQQGRKRAPVHLIFFDSWEQRLFLEALSRHLTAILGAAPALYDFITQLAAFDSPVATFLDQEIREQKNLPMVCQSLQAIAARMGFKWNEPEDFTQVFRTRLFDEWHRLDPKDRSSSWITGRARFSSQIPLEYAYAAWGELAGEEHPRYADATPELLRRFQARRLEALEWVAGDCQENKLSEKGCFDLPDLAQFQDRAQNLAQALNEFVTIERHVELGEWKAARHIPPERRVLMGETLLVRYRERDQDPETLERLREYRRRQRLKEQYRSEARTANPDATRTRLSKEQRAEVSGDLEGLRVRLKLEVQGVDCTLDEALGLSLFKEGERLVLNPRWTRDERPDAVQQAPFTPTARQMLYGQRVSLGAFDLQRDHRGEAQQGWVEVEYAGSRGGNTNGFTFGSMDRELVDGDLYTLDPAPDNWYGFWCSKITRALCDQERGGAGAALRSNTLYALLCGQRPSGSGSLFGRTCDGQERFLAGLQAFEAAGHFHSLEPPKQDYIGRYGDEPLLLVQGPPGTGKSYGTAFALFARMQAALEDGREFRVFVSCKTHAATDVLLENVRNVQERLRELRRRDPGLFARYFHSRLLEVPLYRVAPREGVGDGIRAVPKDEARNPGDPKALDLLTSREYWIAGATPGGIYGLVKDNLFAHRFCDCLVLDEASQMNLPEAIMAALPLKEDGQLVVVGDHRQMPPIVQHDWNTEPRRTFQDYQAYQSLFEALQFGAPIIRFEESFRLHADMAEFLRQEVYVQDGIHYHSRRQDLLPRLPHPDPFVAAVLAPEHPIVVVLHNEAESQNSNRFEQALIEPLLQAMGSEDGLALDPEEGLGVVVPHRAQRAALQAAVPCLTRVDPATGAVLKSAVDTVERFQGGERTAVLVSATESDREYLLASSQFLLDPRRLTVAASRAKRKLVLVASETVFQLFSPDEETFRNGQLWKNLLRRTCTCLLWEGERGGHRVQVWGNAGASPTPKD